MLATFPPAELGEKELLPAGENLKLPLVELQPYPRKPIQGGCKTTTVMVYYPLALLVLDTWDRIAWGGDETPKTKGPPEPVAVLAKKVALGRERC